MFISLCLSICLSPSTLTDLRLQPIARKLPYDIPAWYIWPMCGEVILAFASSCDLEFWNLQPLLPGAYHDQELQMKHSDVTE